MLLSAVALLCSLLDKLWTGMSVPKTFGVLVPSCCFFSTLQQMCIALCKTCYSPYKFIGAFLLQEIEKTCWVCCLWGCPVTCNRSCCLFNVCANIPPFIWNQTFRVPGGIIATLPMVFSTNLCPVTKKIRLLALKTKCTNWYLKLQQFVKTAIKRSLRYPVTPLERYRFKLKLILKPVFLNSIWN